jgi:hypothetical protein
MTAPWWATFGPAEATCRCGGLQHRLRWEAGRLIAPDHPEAEGELVLGALGGDQPECIRLLRAWGEHSDDLDMLMLGPRSSADTLTVDSRDAEQLRRGPPGWPGRAPRPGPAPDSVIPGTPLTWGSLWFSTLRSFAVNARGLPRGTVTYGPGHAARTARVARPRAAQGGAFLSHRPGSARAFLPGSGQDLDGELARRAELLELLVLGPAFQFRLSATVAAAWSERDPGTARPALTAALAGRLAPAVAAWLHINPDDVSCSIGAERAITEQGGGTKGMRAAMPVSWLSEVWAPGLALVDGHLVTDITRAEFPDVDVLALEVPDGEPVALVVQCQSAASSSQVPRLRITGQ